MSQVGWTKNVRHYFFMTEFLVTCISLSLFPSLSKKGVEEKEVYGLAKEVLSIHI
jgi:hypothetical protein